MHEQWVYEGKNLRKTSKNSWKSVYTAIKCTAVYSHPTNNSNSYRQKNTGTHNLPYSLHLPKLLYQSQTRLTHWNTHTKHFILFLQSYLLHLTAFFYLTIICVEYQIWNNVLCCVNVCYSLVLRWHSLHIPMCIFCWSTFYCLCP